MGARPARRSRRRERRGGGPELTTIWWRDIPTQVIARPADGGEPVRTELPRVFLRAIDRTAMEIGLAGTDAYLAQWDRRSRPCGDDLEAEVAAEVDRLVAAHPRALLRTLVANGAYSPERLPNHLPNHHVDHHVPDRGAPDAPDPSDPDDPTTAGAA